MKGGTTAAPRTDRVAAAAAAAAVLLLRCVLDVACSDGAVGRAVDEWQRQTAARAAEVAITGSDSCLWQSCALID